ncbi:uncharacterized protein LOC106156427 [Lingula anatina]|uniref:Uncharacterized protein LOC106156427 n=1 Tax=Lingula anatina TaxID=7574 RepID=A0A2R2MSL3_LINAN|nr:uncharacterized protein LOC106156427 [Lingula anatina]|eukprot:XP_023933251.1 uncharacterized protein LOC106156427 [Lingula anatina]
MEPTNEGEQFTGALAISTDKDMNSPRSLRIQHYLSVRHALPKTKIHRAILSDNAGQDRRLDMTVSHLSSTQKRNRFFHEQNIRTFLNRQKRKQNKWRREDNVRVASMNLPTYTYSEAKERPRGMETVYHNPRYSSTSDHGKIHVPLSPRVQLPRERTEIVLYRDKTVVTKFPTVVDLDPKTMERYEKYRGKDYLVRGVPAQDERFGKLATSLETLPVQEDLTLKAIQFQTQTTRGGVSRHGKIPANWAPQRSVTEPQIKVMMPSMARHQRSNSSRLSYNSGSTHSKIEFTSETRELSRKQ